MLIATLAISGIPGMSGFFSKDEILWKSFSSDHGHWVLWVVGVATAGLTAFYMFRLIYLTFYGKERMDDHTRSRIHESPRSMTVPLMILAVLSVVGGFVGVPHIFFGATNYFERWLEPVMAGSHAESASHALASNGGDTGWELALMVMSVLLVLIALYAAHYLYRKNLAAATSLRKTLSGLHRLILHKYYVDEVYGIVIVRPVVAGALFLWKFVDVILIDGFFNGAATVCRDISDTLRHTQSGQLRGYATIFVTGVVIVLGWFMFG
jgi:NADH-quinone oxidoreductase subunit L